jgi:hypothetical protein
MNRAGILLEAKCNGKKFETATGTRLSLWHFMEHQKVGPELYDWHTGAAEKDLAATP